MAGVADRGVDDVGTGEHFDRYGPVRGVAAAVFDGVGQRFTDAEGDVVRQPGAEVEVGQPGTEAVP
jgi:hypothetical protein